MIFGKSYWLLLIIGFIEGFVLNSFGVEFIPAIIIGGFTGGFIGYVSKKVISK